MKVAFQNVKGKKKRGPGLDVNLGSLFVAAKAEDTIVTESWNTLGASVTTISRQLRERSENNIQPDNMEPENATAEEAMSEEDLNEDDYILENGFNISTQFRQFNLKSHSDTLRTHEDLLRLVNFCKDTLDKKDVKPMIAVQAVGYYVTIYLFSLEATGLYLLTELYSFNVPKSISELPQFVMHFDEIKKIMVCYEENCVLANDIHKESRKRMSIQQQNTHNILNIKKSKKLHSSIAFK